MNERREVGAGGVERRCQRLGGGDAFLTWHFLCSPRCYKELLPCAMHWPSGGGTQPHLTPDGETQRGEYLPQAPQQPCFPRKSHRNDFWFLQALGFRDTSRFCFLSPVFGPCLLWTLPGVSSCASLSQITVLPSLEEYPIRSK